MTGFVFLSHRVGRLAGIGGPIQMWFQKSCMQEACTALQLCGSSLRRAVQDMGKMGKALEKVRKQMNRQKANAGADAAAAQRSLVGRTNFTKVLGSSDPKIMQSFKTLLQKRPMKQVKDVEELSNGTCDSELPFKMAKGRGLNKLLVKDASIRGNLEATIQEFAKKVEAAKDCKTLLLDGVVLC